MTTDDRSSERGSTGAGGNLAARFEHRSDRVALFLAERSVTHADLADRVARWRGGLVAAGVRAGDRVGIVATNGELLVVAHLAAMGVGAVSVPLNPRCAAPELARELRAVAADAVVGDAVGAAVLARALAHPDAADVDPIRLEPAAVDGSQPAPLAHVAPDDIAVLLFTSGTAGAPRPAALTHGNLTAALGSMLSLPTDLTSRPQVLLGVVPMFHVLGLSAILHLGLALGGSVVLQDFPGAPETIDLIERHGVTVALGPPNLWDALAGVPDVEHDRLASVDLALSGASALPGTTKLAVADRLGLRLDEGYGLTESSAVAASTVATTAPPGSVGRLAPGVEGRIVDDTGEDCLAGDPGELLLRGPMVFAGYWSPGGLDRSPVDGDGWLSTGDLAVVDDAGYLALVGRSKDLIIVSGFNVYPGEVEAVLAEHPDVADVGVVGEPSDETGEAIVAFVVPGPGRTIESDELRSHCQAELARYKVPARFVVAPNLPIGPTGKLQRNRLR